MDTDPSVIVNDSDRDDTDPSVIVNDSDQLTPQLVPDATTYVASPTRQPTNLPTNHPIPKGKQAFIGRFVEKSSVPAHYISVRVTIVHDDWMIVYNALGISEVDWYISYPHTGKDGTNEHYHVFLPGGTPADRERFRKRLKSVFVGGNRDFSVKLMQNGLTSAITYGSREGTVPIWRGPLTKQWIDASPEWVESRPGKGLKRDSTGAVSITGLNMMRLAWDYHKSQNAQTTDLAEVLEAMLNSGDYNLAMSVVNQGVPDWYLEVFRESVERGRLKWTNSIWRQGVFRPPR